MPMIKGVSGATLKSTLLSSPNSSLPQAPLPWLSLLYTHTHTHTHTYIYTHTYIHTYIQTYIHTYIHKYIHTYIHTYIYNREEVY